MFELLNILAEGEIFDKWHIAFAAFGAAVGIGLLGMKAAEGTGRNPGAATPILVLAIILAALIEGAFIMTLLLG